MQTVESTRDRMIREATDLFFCHGFNAVGLDQIIDRVGVTKTTFYKYFDSKDDLVLAVIEHNDRQDIEELVQGMAARGGGSPRSEILALFDLVDEWFRSPEFRGCLFMNAATEFPSPNDPIHVAAVGHSRHVFELMRERAARAGAANPDALASQLSLLLAGALTSRHVSKILDAASTARSVAEALLRAHLPGHAA